MGKSGLSALFSTPVEKTEEEKKKEHDELQQKHNPFLKGPGEPPGPSEFGYSYGGTQYCHEGKFQITMDGMGESLERYYYFFQKQFRKKEYTTFGTPIKDENLYKFKDVFDASVSSSFHGHIGGKISAIQQQISTYLTQIGQLTKTLLPMVREIRMMKERMAFYEDSYSDKPGNEKARQSEVALKSTWIEVVEQGMQNPNSVYSMATKLGFVTLPDLFFGINPHGKTPDEQKERLHKYLGEMQKQHDFNQKVRNALEKKLTQYYNWKKHTYNEMKHTWKFRLKALRQHYNVIQLYTSWLKPNMTALKALQMRGDIKSPDIIMSFESSKLELELMAVISSKKVDEGDGKSTTWNSCLMIRFNFITRPDLHYAQGGQRQPAHAGQIDISIEPYVATTEDIKWYKKHTEKEMLKTIGGSPIDFQANIEDTLGSFGDEVEEYLKEAGAELEEKKKEKKKTKSQESLFTPFEGLTDSVKMFIPDTKQMKENKKRQNAAHEHKLAKKKVEGPLFMIPWVFYDVFKKVNGMYTPP